ncbi:hypothetical protein QVD99_007901 [Batrachochytrium dendrobatidis]|nr:hypothetical protein QVD99_007901 [Batrachochytrium dendrobatidis]
MRSYSFLSCYNPFTIQYELFDMSLIKFFLTTLFLNTITVSAQGIGIAGSPQAAQAGVEQFQFFLQAPGNCLISHTDLPIDAPSKNLAALWIRAVFHDAGTWDPNAVAPALYGGANAGIRSFANVSENAGLFASLAPRFQQNTAVNMSAADTIALAGLTSVTHCGGPHIPYSPGRIDTTTPQTPIGRIPEANERYLTVKPKLQRMGWTNEDIVVLVTGSHTMGGIHAANSPQLTNKSYIPFDTTPGVFDNDVFIRVLAGHCPVPVDCDIANDPELRPIVQRYAADQKAFFDQYAISFAKLSNQVTGVTLNPAMSISIAVHANLLEEGTTDLDGKILSGPNAGMLGNGMSITGSNTTHVNKATPSQQSNSSIMYSSGFILRGFMLCVVWISTCGILSFVN